MNYTECFSLALLALAIAGCERSDNLPLAGTIAIGGKPVDRGLITFAPVDAKNKPAGAAIANGKFASEEGRDVLPGEYLITVTALRRTGRQIQDRMSPKPIDELVPMEIRKGALPATVTISAENSRKLELDFPAAR